jgi:outer membrane protein TolC
MMKRNATFILLISMAFFACFVAGQETGITGPPRHITLQEAVELALKHNHDVRIAGYTVEEKQHATEVAKSYYFPSIRNDSSFFHLTNTQLIEIPAGSLGVVAGTRIPALTSIINQGALDITTSGTTLTQPLTTLMKIRPQNDMARAELKASREKAQLTSNDVALQVHQVYYKILITQAHRSATEARIKASQALESERIQQVKLGSVLQQDLIESRAQRLDAQQELLTTDLQLADFKLKLNDLIGLPLSTALDLDPSFTEFPETCRREECVATAMASHPQIRTARAEVEKAQAAAHLANVDIWVPDLEAFANYTYANNVPFLARNFGTFGVRFGYDLFEAGRKRGVLHERQAQLSQAKENLAKVTDEVKLDVETAYNKLERTQQMLKVSEEALALRTESSRVLQQELAHGAALTSQANHAVAQEFDAKTVLLQTQLDYTVAHDEVIHAIGQTPK